MFARKHVSIIPVSIACPLMLCLSNQSLQKHTGIHCKKVDGRLNTGTNCFVKPQMQIRVRLIKKPSGQRKRIRSPGLSVLLRLCPVLLDIGLPISPRLTRNKAKALR